MKSNRLQMLLSVFYDYHRKDANGNERELHLKEAIECLSYDQKEMENKLTTVMTSLEKW